MKPNSLENLLKQDAPQPDPAARVAARRAALAEFARTNPQTANDKANDVAAKPRNTLQGLLGLLRLSSQTRGSDTMPWYMRRGALSGAAGVCVAVIGSVLVWTTLQHDPDVVELKSPVAAPTAAGGPPAQETAATPGSAAPTEATSTAAQNAAVDTQQRLDDANRDAGADAGLRAAEGDKRRNELMNAQARQAPELEPLPPPVSYAPELAGAPAAAATEPAQATAPAAAKAGESGQLDEVTVTGVRKSLQQSMEIKREAAPVVEAIQAEELYEMSSERRGARAAPHKGAPAARQSGGSRGRTSAAILTQQVEPAAAPPAAGRDQFEHFDLNSIRQPAIEDERVSTFSADVDTSSYSFVRKQLNQGVLPQKDAVRAEEMINYFDYAWPAAETRERPFQPTVVVSDSPWGKGRKLIHIGIKGYELPASQRPHANLVLLLDVSGSMADVDKLPLVKQSMKLMLGSLKPTDTVAIVVYAGAAGLVLPPTALSEKEKIVAALDSLTPGGSTAGAEGIELAYQLAEQSFVKEGVNRILLCTDGDFNVGIDSTRELKGFVERKREKGIFLSVLGFGQGNYRDELAQALAQNGNGVAAYIDTLSEAEKVLVQESGSSLFTIAKDVKLQVEFNPATVAEYRLVGYETRALKREDFNNDKVDAGDVGSGHTVTAIYEITPVGVDARMITESRYVKQAKPTEGTATEYGFLQIRYKLPKESKSQLITQPISIDSGKVPEAIARDVQFSTAVAGFAQLLRGGQYTGSLNYEDVIKQALAARGDDPYGYRNEFVQLVRKAQSARGM
jgi:Ca-activated chloride channel family protein